MGALGEGALAGLGIAVPVGPIAVLIVDLGMRRGFRRAFAAGLGAASADLVYASVAALAGLAAADALQTYADRLRVVSVGVLAAIVVYRTGKLLRPTPAARTGARPDRSHGGTYVGFLGLTLLNPLTVTYFAALMLGLQAGAARTGTGKALFVLGAGLASALWQTLLAGAGAAFHRRLPQRAGLATGLIGNLVVAALAVRLALAG